MLNETHLSLTADLKRILEATVQSGWLHGKEDTGGIAVTKQLVAALEHPQGDRKFLAFLLGHFESTMMGYEDNVTWLEEAKLLPEGCSARTIRTVRQLRAGIHGEIQVTEKDE